VIANGGFFSGWMCFLKLNQQRQSTEGVKTLQGVWYGIVGFNVPLDTV